MLARLAERDGSITELKAEIGALKATVATLGGPTEEEFTESLEATEHRRVREATTEAPAPSFG